MSQREMRFRNQHSSTADHQRVSSRIDTEPWEPLIAIVTSVTLRAFCPVSGTPRPQPPHEVVERALAPEITRTLDAPQDFRAWKVWILAQPLRDLRRVWRHGRRAPGAASSRRRRLLARARAIHGRTPSQIQYRDHNSRKISDFCGAGQELAWRVSDRTDHSRANAAAVPERSDVRRPRWSYIGRIVTRLPVTFGE